MLDILPLLSRPPCLVHSYVLNSYTQKNPWRAPGSAPDLIDNMEAGCTKACGIASPLSPHPKEPRFGPCQPPISLPSSKLKRQAEGCSPRNAPQPSILPANNAALWICTPHSCLQKTHCPQTAGTHACFLKRRRLTTTGLLKTQPSQRRTVARTCLRNSRAECALTGPNLCSFHTFHFLLCPSLNQITPARIHLLQAQKITNPIPGHPPLSLQAICWKLFCNGNSNGVGGWRTAKQEAVFLQHSHLRWLHCSLRPILQKR